MSRVNIPVKVKCWKNKSGIWIMHSKRYDISSYGSTKKRAKKMLLWTVKNILEHSMSQMQRDYVKRKIKK